MKYIVNSIVIWNLIVFLIYGMDKHYAKKKSQRISEKVLLIVAFLFGALGACAGMLLFRHKTKKLKFIILMPLAIAFNIVVVFIVLYQFLN